MGESRVELEKKLRMAWAMSVISMTMSVALIGVILITYSRPGSNAVQEVIRARMLVIEDEAGTDRIVLGAPMPSPKGMVRRKEQTGMMINDADGEEQFGVGVDEEGGMSMGFDARPGAGDDRNRERITIYVAPNGNANIRFLDNYTRVKMVISTEGEGEASYNFWDWSGESPEYVSFTLRDFMKLKR